MTAPIVLRSTIAALLLLAIGATAQLGFAPTTEGREIAFSLVVGAVFGIVLQRSRFCFFCNLRDFRDRRDPRGVLSIIVALAVGLVLTQAVIGAWMPVPRAGALPPDAHIGPVGPALAFAAMVFGVGMTVSGSCLSAHLYRLGEGSPTSPFALIGALAGFGLGFLTWNPIYLLSISYAPVVWLPHTLGYTGALVLALAVLAGLALLVLRMAKPVDATDAAKPGVRAALSRVFVERWPAILGGVAVGVISAIAYLRVGPLGVTAEIGSLSRTAGAAAGLLPETLHGLDGFRGCATAVKEALLSRNGAFVAALVVGSFASALAAGQFKPAIPTSSQVVRGLVGGVLMGWAAMTALGCTVGVLLSGIHAGALSGWVFLVFCVAGTWASLAVAGRIGAGTRRA